MTERIVVLDHGSYTIKAGYVHSNISAEAELPPLITPTRVRLTSQDALASQQKEQKEHENGVNGVAKLQEGEPMEVEMSSGAECSPIQQGVICNWDQMEALWHYILYEQLGWEKGNEGSLLIAERVLSTSKLQREMLTQVMFEKFNATGLYMADQPRLSLSAYGKVSGCVIDVGHANIGVSCVTEGQVQLSSCEQLQVGGEKVAQFLEESLKSQNLDLSEKQIYDIKHEFMQVCGSKAIFDSSVSEETPDTQQYKLPDGAVVDIGHKALLCGELPFQPERFGCLHSNLPDTIYVSISSIPDVHMRRTLSESLLICGAGASVKGLEQRLLHDLRISFPPSNPNTLLKRPDYIPVTCPEYSSWVGGFIEAKLAFPQNQQMTKYDYDENGPNGIHKKAFL